MRPAITNDNPSPSNGAEANRCPLAKIATFSVPCSTVLGSLQVSSDVVSDDVDGVHCAVGKVDDTRDTTLDLSMTASLIGTSPTPHDHLILVGNRAPAILSVIKSDFSSHANATGVDDVAAVIVAETGVP